MLLSIYLYLWPKTDMLQTFLYRIHEKSWCGTRIRMSIEFRRHVEWLVSTSWYVDACNKFMKRISWLTTWGPAGVSSTTSIVTSDLCPESSKFKDLVIPSILVWEKKREIIKKKTSLYRKYNVDCFIRLHNYTIIDNFKRGKITLLCPRVPLAYYFFIRPEIRFSV